MANKPLIITNADIYTPQQMIPAGTIVIEGGKIRYVGNNPPPDLPLNRDNLNLAGCIIAPGLIDLHNHGAQGVDFTDTPPQNWLPALKYMTSQGTTAYLATLISNPHEKLLNSTKSIAAYCSQKPSAYAECLGIHLEGPYLNPRQKGVHNQQYLRLPNIPEIEKYIRSSKNLLKMLTLAPELDEKLQVIDYLTQQGIVAAAGHSAADYNLACQAIAAGLKYTVHIFNTLPPLHHREPGILGAVLADERVYCEVIADGIHLHPAILKLLYKIKGTERLILATDSAPLAGLPPGQYQWLDQTITVAADRLNNEAGKLAGSSLTLAIALKNMLKWSDCSLAEALTMATFNPAQALGLQDIGQLAENKAADLVVFQKDLMVKMVIKRGKIIWP